MVTCNSCAVVHLGPVLLLDQIQLGLRRSLQNQVDLLSVLQGLTDPVKALQSSLSIQILLSMHETNTNRLTPTCSCRPMWDFPHILPAAHTQHKVLLAQVFRDSQQNPFIGRFGKEARQYLNKRAENIKTSTVNAM